MRLRATDEDRGRLGIGCPYLPMFPSIFSGGAVDFVEISPETLSTPVLVGGQLEFCLDADRLRAFRACTAGLPVVLHGVELSLGAADGWEQGALRLYDAFIEEVDVRWLSEHLSYQTWRGRGGEKRWTGVPLPLPATSEAVALVRSRRQMLEEHFQRPVLVENLVHYFPRLPSDCGLDEMTFLNAVAHGGRGGLLLDLFNLYCNAKNRNEDARESLFRLDLNLVVEMHLAGGPEVEGLLLDGHDRAVPEEVWSLLQLALSRAPRCRGVVFEVLDAVAPQLGEARICDELARLRDETVSWSGGGNGHGPPAVAGQAR